MSTETLLLTFPDDATVNQFSAAVTKIKENKVHVKHSIVGNISRLLAIFQEKKDFITFFLQTPSMFSERTEESSASQCVALLIIYLV